MASLIKDPIFLTYIEEDAFMEVSIAGDNEKQAQDLIAQSNHHVDALPCGVNTHHVSNELYEEAQSVGMGVGRYVAAQQLRELDSTITLDECRNMTMRELRERILAADPDAAVDTGMGGHNGDHGAGHSQGSGDGMGKRQGRNKGF